MRIRAGQLRRRITILQRSRDVGPTGQDRESFAVLAKVWAGREQVGGSDQAAADTRFANQTGTVYTIRFRKDIDTTMRIQDGAQEFDIEDVAASDDRVDLHLRCRSVTPSSGGS